MRFCKPRVLYASGHPFDHFCFSPTGNNTAPAYGGHKEHLEKGKITKIQDMGFT